MLKIIKKSYNKLRTILSKKTITRTCIHTCLLIFVFLLLYSGVKSIAWQNNESWVVHDAADPVLRVHILAHNDSPEEQRLKNRVRDDFLILTAHYRDKNSLQEVIETIEQERDRLEFALNKKISQYGNADNREATVKLQKEYFPLRHYGEKIYPPGEYTALIVTIGEGVGENWWCLLYPPLCFPLAQVSEDEETEQSIENELSYGNSDDVIEAMAVFNDSNQDYISQKDGKEEIKEEKTEGRWKLMIWEWMKSRFEKE